MKRFNKNAIKRWQSRTCLNYAECKHFGRSQTKGMYALLVAVATLIGITIYGSCSADEEYDGYSSGDELFTLADKEMNLRTEPQGTVWFYGDYIDSAGISYKNCQLFNDNLYHANLTFQWTIGWTGNISEFRSQMYVSVTSIHYSSTEENALYVIYQDGQYYNAIYNPTMTATGEWKPDMKLHVDITIHGNVYRIYDPYILDHPNSPYMVEYLHYGSKKFADIQQYNYSDLQIQIHQ